MENSLNKILEHFSRSYKSDNYDLNKLIENIPYDSNHTELETQYYINNVLKEHMYNNEISNLIEKVNSYINEDIILYSLKHLYTQILNENTTNLYNYPLNIIMEIINLPDNNSRVNRIINELSQFNWIPRIKQFVQSYIDNPLQKQNIESVISCANKVYTFVDYVDDGSGQIAFIEDKWFIFNTAGIETTQVDKWVRDENCLKIFKTIEEVLKVADVCENCISFKLEEELIISIEYDTKLITINDQPISEDGSIEAVFSSPMIPFAKRTYYSLIVCALQNIDKFINLDVCMHIYNKANIYTSCYVFNYLNKLYLYSIDKRNGNNLFPYDSAHKLVADIQNEFEYDITYFVQQQLTSEKMTGDYIQQSKHVRFELDKTNKAILALEAEPELIDDDNELHEMYVSLLEKRNSLEDEISFYETKHILNTYNFEKF